VLIFYYRKAERREGRSERKSGGEIEKKYWKTGG
jgi:hypothetical protein